MENLVGRYAQLSATSELMARQGKPVPHAIARELMQIESMAKTRLSPEQMHAALEHVEVAKAAFLQENQAHYHATQKAEFDTRVDRLSRNMTKGMFAEKDGLSPAQFQQLRDTGKVTLPTNTRVDPKRANQIVRESTRNLDPSGQGWSKHEWTQRLDALSNARATRNHTEFDRLAKGYRTDPAKLAKAADDWITQRVTFGLKERRDAATPAVDETIEASPQDRRKAHIADAYLASVEKGESDLSNIEGKTPPHLLKEDGVRGDVARAMESHEHNVPVSEVREYWKAEA